VSTKTKQVLRDWSTTTAREQIPFCYFSSSSDRLVRIQQQHPSLQLELALLNLVVNSRDAMPDGGRIIISGRLETVTSPSGSVLEPGQYVCLSITDTGAGMDEATHDRRGTDCRRQVGMAGSAGGAGDRLC
jgi:signal transduction histidine kinase